MLIGVDFDNTIVCYDGIFFDVALEMGLITEGIEKSKTAIRDYIQAHHANQAWTLLQSEVYGAHMSEARPYPGVAEFFECCRRQSVSLWIISHKSLYPAVGKAYNLHRSALAWLAENGFLRSDGALLSPERVVFAEARAEKIKQILKLGCTHFIDDLPEVFSDGDFPKNVGRILFDPRGAYPSWSSGIHARSWKQIREMLFSNENRDCASQYESSHRIPQRSRRTDRP
jgi:hypothetical protein